MIRPPELGELAARTFVPADILPSLQPQGDDSACLSFTILA
jgi:hypothetical protein